MSTIDFQDIAASEIKGYTLGQKLTILETAKRHVVKINNIKAEQNAYSRYNAFKSRELISQPVKSIAVFCNEYVPAHFPEGTYFKYVLTVNGTDYDIVPINSNRNGRKIIRATSYSTPSDYVEYLGEEIKSATLSIVLTAPNNVETPYISNLKILIGGDEDV